MIKRQRQILFATAAVIVAMLLIPPFQYQNGPHELINLGYGFLFSPPIYANDAGTVDKGMLLVQWVAVALVGGILCFAFRGRNASDRDESSQ